MTIKKNINILELMIIKINRFFNKSIYISDLIYDLESYLNQLENFENQWKIDFRTIWLDIEVAYSVTLDEGLESPREQENDIIVNSLITLKKMAQDKLCILKINANDSTP